MRSQRGKELPLSAVEVARTVELKESLCGSLSALHEALGRADCGNGLVEKGAFRRAVTSLGLNGIIASQLVSRLHDDVDADADEDAADSWAASAPLPAESAAEVGARERAFFEALGGTTRESVMALLRDGPLEELLVDAIVDGCVDVAKEAAAR